MNGLGGDPLPGGRAFERSQDGLPRRMYEDHDHWPGTAPVYNFAPGGTPEGIQDLAGNLREWVADWYAPYPGGSVQDLHGPERGEERVLRGSSFLDAEFGAVVLSRRAHAEPSLASPDLGFRCARPPGRHRRERR
jgi:formylglycine-generating enzyme required for sulfatase activity